MSKHNVVKAYFQGLEKSNYPDVIKLFPPNAVVHSPMHDQEMEVTRFYKELFSVTRSSKITLKNIFVNPDNPNTAAGHFVYSWILKDGTLFQFECVDVFDFIPESDKIKTLTIIYDTYNRRERIGKSRQ